LVELTKWIELNWLIGRGRWGGGKENTHINVWATKINLNHKRMKRPSHQQFCLFGKNGEREEVW
jgi:hypothetical protein